ncbi:fumarylacetoacetase [Variovorax sp. RT4R15]|uniref:fumarylacetoacetase n=1 Tax=Variovorax sp. RT4R15 TaxID=3443737 RepID=UPI003F445BA5
MTQLNATHDPARRSWVEAANVPAHDFPLQNLPLGVYAAPGRTPRVGIAIGDQLLDIAEANRAGFFTGLAKGAAQAAAGGSLNELMALGSPASSALRMQVFEMLAIGGGAASARAHAHADQLLLPSDAVEMQLPCAIGGFTDFLTSSDHLSRARRSTHPDNPVPEAFYHLPLAYNSRASSVRVSGHNVLRPHGQSKGVDGAMYFGPAKALDFELELGAFVGPGNALGSPIPLRTAQTHLFGYCLLNDWSARDIQRWETTPLGPFLGKSFCSVVSPWVVSAEALAPFHVPARTRAADEPAVLPHLHHADDIASGGLDLQLEAWLTSARMRADGMPPLNVTQTNSRYLYWTFAQMVTHHTSNGCNLRPGDLLGSGTASGPDPASRGCLAEFHEPLLLPDGTTRQWLIDGDELVFKARASKEGHVSIGFGECRSRVLPAAPWPTGN